MCCGIVILFIIKVLSIVLFEGFKVVGVVSCGVCKDNSKVVVCGVSVVIHKVIGRLWMV